MSLASVLWVSYLMGFVCLISSTILIVSFLALCAQTISLWRQRGKSMEEIQKYRLESATEDNISRLVFFSIYSTGTYLWSTSFAGMIRPGHDQLVTALTFIISSVILMVTGYHYPELEVFGKFLHRKLFGKLFNTIQEVSLDTSTFTPCT